MMEQKDAVKLKDNVLLVLRGPDGKVKDVREVHNTIPTNGLAHYADQLAEEAQAAMGWMEVGTGVPTATLLGAYILNSRTSLSSKTHVAGVITYVCILGPGVGTGAIIEAGVFNIVTQNTITMGLSSAFAVINKGALDTLTITWTLTLA